MGSQSPDAERITLGIIIKYATYPKYITRTELGVRVSVGILTSPARPTYQGDHYLPLNIKVNS